MLQVYCVAGVLQCFALCCSVLQCVSSLKESCNVLQVYCRGVAVCCSVLQCVHSLAKSCIVLQVCCSVLHCVAGVLQCVAVC